MHSFLKMGLKLMITNIYTNIAKLRIFQTICSWVSFQSALIIKLNKIQLSRNSLEIWLHTLYSIVWIGLILSLPGPFRLLGRGKPGHTFILFSHRNWDYVCKTFVSIRWMHIFSQAMLWHLKLLLKWRLKHTIDNVFLDIE